MKRVMRLAVLAAGLALAGGCASRKGPFQDVVTRQPGQAQEPPRPQAPPTLETPAVATAPAATTLAPAPAVAASAPSAAPAPIAQAAPPSSENAVEGSQIAPPGTPFAGPTLAPVSADATLAKAAVPIIFAQESPALIQRQWTLSVNFRPSGDSLTGHVYKFPVPTEQDLRPEWQQAVLDPVAFMASVLLLPVRLVENPPWTTTVTSPMNDQQWTPMGPVNARDAK